MTIPSILVFLYKIFFSVSLSEVFFNELALEKVLNLWVEGKISDCFLKMLMKLFIVLIQSFERLSIITLVLLKKTRLLNSDIF